MITQVRSPKVLIADDDESVLRVMRHHLKLWGCRTAGAVDKAALRREIAEERPAVLLLDVRFGEHDGIEILRELKAEDPRLEVILMTAFGSIDMAVTALKLGATDYVTKPPDLMRLKSLIGDAVARVEAETAIATGAEKAASTKSTPSAPNRDLLLIGHGLALEQTRKAIAAVAPTDASVLILGESGTGKEVVARSIHAQSNRGDRPFIALNMAAFPRDLVESILFGHEKGAFTGADQAQAGSVEAADGGTLFLDEIGEMDINLQAKLLRFLQERTFQRVGAARSRPVDVRIIAATNRNPLEQVRKGLLREDLYYRLNVVPITLPPLRDRPEDIPDLAAHFLRRASARHGKSFSGFSLEALNRLIAYDWPGNIRQLENLIERLVIFSPGPIIERGAIPPEIDVAATSPGVEASEPFGHAEHSPLRKMDRVEKQTIEEALRNTHGSVRDAARALGIGQATIYRKIKRYGIRQT